MKYGRWKVNMAKKKRSKSTLQIPFPEFNFKRELETHDKLPDFPLYNIDYTN